MNTQEEFTITAKKRISIKPFFEVFEVRRKNESKNNYFVQVYNLSELKNQKIQQSLKFNQAIFTESFSLSASNLIKIIKIEKSEIVSAHFVQKYDKNLEQYLKSRKKGRLSQQMCLIIMEDILKGLATILQAGYRPVGIRADNIVRCFSKNPEQRQDIWKIKNVVYSSSFFFEQQNFLTFEQKYSPPQIYSRRNYKDHEFQESQQYVNGLLVWSLGIIFAKMLGVEGKLDSKKKLSSFRDRQFNIFDILYIRKEYSEGFLKMIASMLHFDNKKRMKLKDLFYQPLFSTQLCQELKKQPASVSVQTQAQSQGSDLVMNRKNFQREMMKDVINLKCSLCQFLGIC